MTTPTWGRFRPTAHYLMETEAHVYALAVAASTLLAFYPFMTVMLSLCRDVLRWPAAQEAIYLALGMVAWLIERGPGDAADGLPTGAARA